MKNTFFKTLILVVFCVVSSSIAMAYPAGSIYMCNLSNNRVLSAHHPIPECADKEQRVFGPNGLVIDVIPPVSEVRAREKLLAQQAEEARLRAIIASKKDQLLLVYPNAAVHDAQRQQNLAPLYEKLKESNEQIALLQNQLANVAGTVTVSQTSSSSYPKEQQDKIQADLSVQQHIALTLRQQIDFINQKYDEEKKFLAEYWGKK